MRLLYYHAFVIRLRAQLHCLCIDYAGVFKQDDHTQTMELTR
jgi:hypothetical protein